MPSGKCTGGWVGLTHAALSCCGPANAATGNRAGFTIPPAPVECSAFTTDDGYQNKCMCTAAAHPPPTHRSGLPQSLPHAHALGPAHQPDQPQNCQSLVFLTRALAFIVLARWLSVALCPGARSSDPYCHVHRSVILRYVVAGKNAFRPVAGLLPPTGVRAICRLQFISCRLQDRRCRLFIEVRFEDTIDPTANPTVNPPDDPTPGTDF